jgi:hypothetical protein
MERCRTVERRLVRLVSEEVDFGRVGFGPDGRRRMAVR